MKQSGKYRLPAADRDKYVTAPKPRVAPQAHPSAALQQISASPGGQRHDPAQVLSLQRAAGNRAVNRLLAQHTIQARFAAGPAGDERNSEAGRAARPEGAQRRNLTGLPDRLKSGVESLSGLSLDRVRVHYNSSQPADLNALAYAKGPDIHVAPGHERHLPHEAWHVVQQAQGRVKPTLQLRGGVPANDDEGLEHEADVMGAKADTGIDRATEPESKPDPFEPLFEPAPEHDQTAQLKKVNPAKLNVVGEKHSESEARRDSEEAIARHDAEGGYWSESDFRVGEDTRNAWRWIFTSDPRRRGDSPGLLVEMHAAVLAAACRIWRQKVTDYATLTTEVQGQVREHMPALFRFIEDVSLNNSRVEAGARNDDLVEAVDALGRIVYAIARGTDQETYRAFPELIARVEHLLGGRSRADISRERSIYMEESARMSGATRGIWKVGYSHIDEIVGIMAPINPNFEVLTRVEFNTEYQDRLVPDP